MNIYRIDTAAACMAEPKPHGTNGGQTVRLGEIRLIREATFDGVPL